MQGRVAVSSRWMHAGALAPLLAVIAMLSLGAAPGFAQRELDLVLAGGRMIDPESGVDGLRWIGIRAGRVVTISEQPIEGAEVLDVAGRVIAPGFIDLHVHGQEPRSYDFLAADGVTTALDLEAGVTNLEAFLEARRGRARIHYGASAGHVPARARILDGVRLAHALTARQMENGPRLWWTGLRMKLFGPMRYGHARASSEERAEILAALEAELDAGALGIGMGLVYTPGADSEEVRAVFGLAAARKVPVFVHLSGMQSIDDEQPIREVLDYARTTGASVHVVHVNSSGGRSVRDYLRSIEAARAEGLDVTVEAYPYTASSTLIESARFDEGWRERGGGDYGDLQWAETGERLDAESFARYRKQGGVVVNHSMRAEDVDAAIAHPLVMIAADGMTMQGAAPHPRGAGSHARVLGYYVRERGLLDLSTALRKMSLEPARRLEAFVPAMRRKGRIREGADADLVVFDPQSIIDRATFEDPYQVSAGIDHVLVGGHFVLRDGELVPDAYSGAGILADR